MNCCHNNYRCYYLYSLLLYKYEYEYEYEYNLLFEVYATLLYTINHYRT